MLQNNKSFKPNKQAHIFEITRYMIEADEAGIHDNLRQQIEDMEPNKFIKAAIDKYSGIEID